MTEEALFHAALDIDDPQRRHAFLDGACAGDAALRRRVEALLAAFAAGRDRLEPPDGPTVDHRAGDDRKGRVVAGRYELLEPIGEGGMGAVWVARQTEPVQRKVALKLIKPGMDSRQVVARFEAERQALAMMDHPNIARVLDGGLTDDGRPFFVMELINGLPLTRYCDEAKLTPRERLDLFVPVCQAVQHAHQKGVIHRDLKPSNILVTLYDGKPVPKVIDFGVAKALGGKLAGETDLTQFGAVVGTLEYMAPEQAGFSALDVDTRADVYALGVVLYELLTGLRPFDARRLRAAALDEAVRILREEEPPRPSTRVSTDASAPALAAARQTDARGLSRLMRGELDWVVMRCLEKDRSRRYETANGLGRDIQRYLADEPVEARPPSAAYRFGKLLRRNRKAVLAAGAFALLLLAATAVSLALALWADRERGDAVAAREREAEERANAERERHRAEHNEGEAKRSEERVRHSLYVANMNRVRFEIEQGHVARARALLDLYRRPATPASDPRGWEWYYWDRTCQGELYTLPGHQGGAHAVAFSPDGALLATAVGGVGRTIKLWDTATGREVRTWPTLTAQTTWLAFTPDGRTLVSRTGNAVKLWDVSTGQERHSLAPPGKATFGPAALSPDGEALAVSVQEGPRRTTRFWGVRDRQWKGALPQSTSTHLLRYSPDGKKLAQGHEEGATLWDLETREALHTFRGHLANDFGDPVMVRERLTGLAFSHDGRSLATCGRDGTARVHDLQTGKEVRAITIMPGIVHSGAGVVDLTFTPDGTRLITAGEHGSLKSWLIATGREERSFLGHGGIVVGIALTSDGMRLASAANAPNAVAVGEVKIWDATAGPTLCLSPGKPKWTQLPTFSPDGRLLAVAINNADYYGQVEVRHLGDARPPLRLDPGPCRVVATAISPDSKLLATGIRPQRKTRGGPYTYEVRLWGLADGRVVRSFPRLQSTIPQLAFSPDAKSFAFAQVRWEPSTRKFHGEVKVWDLAGQELRSLPGLGLEFSPDGQTLAVVGNDHVLRLLDRGSGRELRAIKGTGSNTLPTFTHDGQRLFFGRSVWEVATGREVCRLEGEVPLARFSPDGKRLFSMTPLPGAVQGHLRVWDAATGDLLLADRVPGTHLDVHPDGWRCAVASDHAAAWVIDARPLTPDLREEHEARNLVAHLFRRPMLRDEVIAFVSGLRTISEPVRRQALALARCHEVSADLLIYAVTEILMYSDRTPEEYRKALKWAEEAYRLNEISGGGVANSLGIALYYVGRYEEAVRTLRHAFELDMKRPWEIISAYDLLFLAMAQHKLGRHERARATLKWARSGDPILNGRHVLPRHWREAEALIEVKSP